MPERMLLSLPLGRLRLHNNPNLPLGPDRFSHLQHSARRCATEPRQSALRGDAVGAKVLFAGGALGLFCAPHLCRTRRRQSAQAGAAPLLHQCEALGTHAR